MTTILASTEWWRPFFIGIFAVIVVIFLILTGLWKP